MSAGIARPGCDLRAADRPLPFREPAHWSGRRRPRGSRNGRILAAVPAREPVGEPGCPVHFVTGRTLHRTHVGRRDQTRPVAGDTTPRDWLLPPGRFPQHAGVPPFRVPATRTGQLCHAEASRWMARPAHPRPVRVSAATPVSTAHRRAGTERSARIPTRTDPACAGRPAPAGVPLTPGVG